ncbi:GGDEF domain-containing protein [Pleionea sediminis]|uniref:GGDEF domain-containing protein n=1 Tax=Pleionea sediminis TaxID=2569479 RepID=UPI00118702CF|nr:GGDEF domain-containing protein [Pleionea sediminis]
MTTHPISILLCTLIFAVASYAIQAEIFTFRDVLAFEARVGDLPSKSRDEKEALLKRKLRNAAEGVERYFFQRELVLFLTNYRNRKDAIEYCLSRPPLENDYLYRAHCAFAESEESALLEEKVVQIITDAVKNNDLNDKAFLLNRLAWWMSQRGEIATAFAYYEEALISVSSENTSLLNQIMFDAATNYIAHGNDEYVKRGIDLMKKFRKSMYEQKEDATDPNVINTINRSIILSEFNSGIAYLLHLEQYDRALDAFQPLFDLNSDISANALSFSAYAAAQTQQIEKAKELYARAEKERDGYATIDQYLACYRRLAEQSWNPEVNLTDCMMIKPDTALEVQIHLFKVLSKNSNKDVQLYGLKKLRDIFENKLEKKLKNQISQTASNVEMKRLQRESELKSVVLEQQKQLRRAIDEKHENRSKLFIAMFVIFLFVIALIYIQFRHKKKMADQFERMSLRDSLTKIGNRRFFEHNIERELSFVKRANLMDHETKLLFCIFDVDHFKKVNDTFGHAVGDDVLKEMAQRINHLIRSTDLFVRWGGEEFICIFRVTEDEQIPLLATRLLSAINNSPFLLNHGELSLNVTCTVGIVAFPFIDTKNIDDWTKLVSLADLALYHGKELGRNCWVYLENINVKNEAQVDTLLAQNIEKSVEHQLIAISTSKEQ